MSVISVKGFSFTYPNGKHVFEDVNFSLERGQLLLLCGDNGCGKSTLLRSLKNEVAPKGKTSGEITLEGNTAILFQECDKNVIFKSVWEDLIFPACNAALPEEDIKARAQEVLKLFRIEYLIGRDTGTLSGGEKQLLSLASLMLLKPDILLLDEPLSQLDEEAKSAFLERLFTLKQNGTTVCIAEHNTDLLFEQSDALLLFEEKQVRFIPKSDYSADLALPNAPEYLKLENRLHCPPGNFTAAEAARNLQMLRNKVRITQKTAKNLSPESSLKVQKLSFAYQKDTALLEDISFTLHEGEIAFLTGNNGAGKSTLLSLICGFLQPHNGQITIADSHRLGYLSQNPMYSFLKDSLEADLLFALKQNRISPAVLQESFEKHPIFKDLIPLLQQNPFDLSGGEKAKAALFKLLLLGRNILLLDEPEKHLDKQSMDAVSAILRTLGAQGISFLIVSHSPDFIYRTADTVLHIENNTLQHYCLKEYFPARCETSLYRAIKGAGMLLQDCSEAEVCDG